MRRRELDDRCLRALRRHVVAGDERTLTEAYDFGRWALAEGVGVLELTLALWRAAIAVRSGSEEGEALTDRIESFMLESLSPFEMAHRGAREANQALRLLDARHEDEVRRVAGELHHEAGQLLATVHLAIDGVRPHLAPVGEERLTQVVDLLHRAENEIRRIAHELRPSILDDLGLMPALRFLGSGISRRAGLGVTVSGSEDGRLPRPIETALYRAAQEALHNVSRHAGASRAAVVVLRRDGEVVCEVGDNGHGFDPQSLDVRRGRRGIGLRSIRERLAPLGGNLEVVSSPQGGTVLRIRIPLEVAHGSLAVS